MIHLNHLNQKLRTRLGNESMEVNLWIKSRLEADRLSRAIKLTDEIMVERGQPTHAERIRMARQAVSSGYPDVGIGGLKKT